MSENTYLLRVPLLDSLQQVIGYKLAWQKTNQGDETPAGTRIRQLLGLVGERLGEFETGVLFLDARSAVLPAEVPEVPQVLGQKNAVLMLNRTDLDSDNNRASAMSLCQQGFGLALFDVDPDFLASNDPLLAFVQYVDVGPDPAAISHARRVQPHCALVRDGISDWQAFDACAALGLIGIFENLCSTPRKSSPAGKLGPQAVLILQLMQMIQENADVRSLENVLKRDATLSYQLFRYINSASFGIEVEIQSLRHAVAMLGYQPLYRWLTLLLAMTNTAGFSPGLLQAAIVRGRFAELLGQGLLSRSEAENLFVVGMFSLLDRLLGVPIEQVLRQIILPEAVVQALLSREGIYGPFLALAEACEQDDGRASDIAEALFMTAARVNQAHLSALAWAHSLKIQGRGGRK